MASKSHLNPTNNLIYICNDSNNFLSNYYPSSFILDHRAWPTVLHYFITKKFSSKAKHLLAILQMTDTTAVYKYSRDENNALDIYPSWDAEKKSIMKEALLAKFQQNIILKQKLLDTGNKEIIELSTDDVYWSQLTDGTGRNHMGVILSKVRCKLMTPQMYQLPTTSSGKQPPLPARRPILNQMTARLIQQRDTIHIPNSKYKELSILSVDPFPLEGHHWWSVQHYFQAKKFRSALVVDQILKTPSPKKAFQIGTDRNNSHLMVEDWDSKREEVMYKAVRAKFWDQPLRGILLDTENKDIVNNSTDSFWGVGKDGNGLNKVGVLLMKVRKEIKQL